MATEENRLGARAVMSIHAAADEAERSMAALQIVARGARLSNEYLKRVADTRLALQRLEGRLGDYLLEYPGRPIKGRMGEGRPA